MEHGFKGYHPAVNMLFFISIVIFGMLFRHPVTLVVGLASSLIYYIHLNGRSAVRTAFCFLLPMLVFVLFINALFAHYGTTPLLTLPGGICITLEALVYGGALGTATCTVILWFFCYGEVVTTDKFLFLFGKILPAAALVVCMALRFVPLYKDRMRLIRETQSGMDDDGKTTVEKIKKSGNNISVLLTWALENAVQTSDSMRARGYGLKGKTSYGKFRWHSRDTVIFSLIVLLDVILSVGFIKKTLYCVYNPYIVINPSVPAGQAWTVPDFHFTHNAVSGFGIITVLAFAVLCLIPLLTDIREEIRWNRLQSKI